MKKIILYAVLTTLILLAMLTGCSNKMDKSSSSIEKDTQNIVFKDNFDNYKLDKFPNKKWKTPNHSPASKIFEKSPGNQAFEIRGRIFDGEHIQVKNSLKKLDQQMSVEFDFYVSRTKNTSKRQIGTFGFLGADFSVNGEGNNFFLFDGTTYQKTTLMHFDRDYHISINYNDFKQNYNLEIYNASNQLLDNLSFSKFERDESGDIDSLLTYRCLLGKYSIDNVIIKAWH